jgi:diacylglycerol kinase family enzyme
MRITLLHNPTAGDDPVPPDELLRDLRWAGYDARYVPVGKGEIELPDDLGQMVVVAGGDGTIRRVAKRLCGGGVPLAILPLGTANNLARSLGQVGAVRPTIAGWRDGVRAALDVGIARGPWGEELFVEAFGGGAFARMIADGRGRRDPDRGGLAGNRIDRGLQMLREAIRAEPCRRWRLRADGDELDGELFLVEVMNARCIGANVPFAPAADPTDGAFELVVAGEADRAAILRYMEERLQGKVAPPPPLTVRRGSRIEAEPGADHMHVDDRVLTGDERGGGGPVEITLARGAIEVVVSVDRAADQPSG